MFTVEFMYNSSVNRTTGMSPFQIVTGYKPIALIDHIPISASHRPSKSASSFASNICALHQEIRRIAMSNEHYKQSVDSHRGHREFWTGDYVMVRFRPK